MDLHQAICPKCGGSSPDGDLCGRCKAEEIEWVKCQGRVTIIRCPCCGSIKEQMNWNDTVREREDVEYEAAASAVQFFRDVKKPHLTITLEEGSANRSFAHIDLTGMLYGQDKAESCTVEVLWQNESCDRCNRLNGNYYEGVVQIRAEERKASAAEQEWARKIALEVEDQMQEQGDRLSFITRIDEGREGLDFIVATQALGDLISREVTRRMGGRFTTHPTLIGEKEGRKLYRITYAVRLPKYQRGDIIAVRQTYGEILRSEGRTMTFLDLKTGLPKTIPSSLEVRFIGNVRDATSVMVTYQDGDTFGIMYPETGKTEEITGASWKHAQQGDTVRVIRDEERVFMV